MLNETSGLDLIKAVTHIKGKKKSLSNSPTLFSSLVLVGSVPVGISINMSIHHSLSSSVILRAALSRSN